MNSKMCRPVECHLTASFVCLLNALEINNTFESSLKLKFYRFFLKKGKIIVRQ